MASLLARDRAVVGKQLVPVVIPVSGNSQRVADEHAPQRAAHPVRRDGGGSRRRGHEGWRCWRAGSGVMEIELCAAGCQLPSALYFPRGSAVADGESPGPRPTWALAHLCLGKKHKILDFSQCCGKCYLI